MLCFQRNPNNFPSPIRSVWYNGAGRNVQDIASMNECYKSRNFNSFETSTTVLANCSHTSWASSLPGAIYYNKTQQLRFSRFLGSPIYLPYTLPINCPRGLYVNYPVHHTLLIGVTSASQRSTVPAMYGNHGWGGGTPRPL